MIFGVGGHGRSVVHAIGANVDLVLGFLDDGQPVGAFVNGIPVLVLLLQAWVLYQFFSGADQIPPDQVVVAVGNPALPRPWQQVLEQVSAPLGVAIYTRASVSAALQIAPGSVVLAGAVVNASASLHLGVLVNRAAVVDHDATCAAYSSSVSTPQNRWLQPWPAGLPGSGEVLRYGETRLAALELSSGKSDPAEGLAPSAPTCPRSTSWSTPTA